MRALLTARELVPSKLFDIEMSLRGILRGFGLKVGKTNPNRFGLRVKELVAGHPTLEIIGNPSGHHTLRRLPPRSRHGQTHRAARRRQIHRHARLGVYWSKLMTVGISGLGWAARKFASSRAISGGRLRLIAQFLVSINCRAIA